MLKILLPPEQTVVEVKEPEPLPQETVVDMIS